VTEGSIVVEQSLLDRLQAGIGDTLQIGSATLTIADIVTLEPDRPVSFFLWPQNFYSSCRSGKARSYKKEAGYASPIFLKWRTLNVLNS